MTCKQCERYKEAAFRDAIEISKYQTALKVAADRLSSAEERVRRETIEECAKVADSFTCGVCGMDGKCAAALRSLSVQTKG